MSKATRLRQQNAREKIAAQRAAARRAEIRRRALWTGSAVVVVIAIVVAFVVIKVSGSNNSSGKSSSTSVTGTVLPTSVQKDITGVPASTLDKVGIGSVPSYMAADEGGAPPITPVSNTPLTSAGKPEMLYIGAEFCPYCGAERWAMAVALSRFGTFTTPLHGIHSSSTDTDPNTPTLTFYQTKYSSPYLVFTPVEHENISRVLPQHGARGQAILCLDDVIALGRKARAQEPPDGRLVVDNENALRTNRHPARSRGCSAGTGKVMLIRAPRLSLRLPARIVPPIASTTISSTSSATGAMSRWRRRWPSFVRAVSGRPSTWGAAAGLRRRCCGRS